MLLVDATRGFDGQVANIFWLAQRNNKGIVILVNKWDLVEDKETNTMKQYTQRIKQAIEIETAVQVYENRSRKIATSKFNDTMLPIIENYPPPAYKGKFVKIKFCMQIPTHYPQFAFYCNLPQYVREPYKRYLENKIRTEFDFTGVPMSIFMRKK